jgi:frataxin-like iron-binding protein CyaY
MGQDSGFVISNDGRFITNYHVIQGAVSGVVRFPEGASYLIEGIVVSNSERDLALLKIKTTSKEFSFVNLRDSDSVQIGEQVVADCFSRIISGVRDVDGLRLLQTTAPISPGNSGGALVDLNGAVVGVPSLTLTLVKKNVTVSQNLNFALPSNYVRELINAESAEVHSLSAAPVRKEAKSPERSPKEIVASAKTLCILVSSGNIILKTELSGKLLQWGRLKLVSSPDEADLILKVVQTGELNLTTGAGNQATVLLTDRSSGTELWSKTKGGGWAMSGFNTAWVARALAKEFIKYFDSTTTTK